MRRTGFHDRDEDVLVRTGSERADGDLLVDRHHRFVWPVRWKPKPRPASFVRERVVGADLRDDHRRDRGVRIIADGLVADHKASLKKAVEAIVTRRRHTPQLAGQQHR